MKYIIVEDLELGHKTPIIFGDNLVHAAVAELVQTLVGESVQTLVGESVHTTVNPRSRVIGAGFIDLGTQFSVYGCSDSLKIDADNAQDEAVIGIGASGSLLPVRVLMSLWAEVKKKIDGEQQSQVADLQSKNARQRQEIARLTRHIEQLQSDKSGLLFDLSKAKAKIALLEV